MLKLLLAALILGLLLSGMSNISHVSAVDAFLDTDKNEVSLGEDLTIRLAEDDANLDSRSIERIPLDSILITTDKFDERPLDEVVGKTGIRTTQSFLRETGFNTGIFEVTLESINSKLVNRGSQIKIIYFDETPSGGGSPVRIQRVIPVVEARILVSFDRSEYSLYDDIEVRLVAQMFNVDRSKIDTLDSGTGNGLAVSTSSGKTFHPPLQETGINTGIFVGKVRLTADERERDGDLLVSDGERIRVALSIVPGFEVSDLADITSFLGEIRFDKSRYSIGEIVTLLVEDRDENKHSDSIDTIQVRVWSNSDILGTDLTLRETESSSGAFKGTFTLSERSSKDTLLVSTDDIILAKYIDKTVPSLTGPVTARDLFARSSVGSVLGKVLVSNPLLLDEKGNFLGRIRTGMNVTIQSSLTNINEMKQEFFYIIHISDEKGLTSQLAFIKVTLEPYQSISIGREWTTGDDGRYTAEIFIWNSLIEPLILAPAKKTIITVE
jgi:hypothetical protein